MLTDYLFPVFDFLVYPLFFLPRFWSLTLVSFGLGIVLMGIYWATSDQWALAHYKQKLKTDQQKLLTEGYHWSLIKRLLKGNVRMGLYGIVPAIVCILFIVMVLPWLGNRFGHYALEPMKPSTVSVQSSSDWTLKSTTNVRLERSTRTFGKGNTSLRFLVENSSPADIELIDTNGNKVEIPLRVRAGSYPIWPFLTDPKWYHSIINPAELALPKNHAVSGVTLGYRDTFPSLAFRFPGLGYVPGWMSWFFIVATVSGLWAKFHWEIE